MKKTLAVGAMVLGVTLLPMASAFADETDTLTVNIAAACTLSREAYATGGVTNNTSHKNGTGSVAGTWSTTEGTNTLSVSMVGGNTTDNLGSSQFKVLCNSDSATYHLNIATTPLAYGEIDSIPNITNYSASTSGWAPIINSTKYTNGQYITATSSSTGTVYEVNYGVGVSVSQTAGTYEGTATYSVTMVP